MAKDASIKKRKASTSESTTEKKPKVKKVTTEVVEAVVKKRKAIEDDGAVEVKRKKKETIEVTSDKPKKTKRSKVQSVEDVEVPTGTAEETNGTKFKPEKTRKKVGKADAKKDKQAAMETPAVTEEQPTIDEDDDSEVDDQTDALLKGFESDGDDEDAMNEDGLPEGQEVPKRKVLDKKQEKALKKAAAESESDEPGVIYIGRIPHGFYEHEMRSYFTQFGDILNLRLSRNKKTGRSKHHAWIQFESATVAEIVAKTMDNYLMFGHLLKVKLVPDEQVPAELFKGANKRFKKVPWNKLEGRKLAQGRSEKVWDEKVEVEKKRREEKAAKLKAIGYEIELPNLKSTSELVRTAKALPVPDATGDTPAIEAPPAVEETSEPKEVAVTLDVEIKESVVVDGEKVVDKKVKKTKKVKKPKSAT